MKFYIYLILAVPLFLCSCKKDPIKKDENIKIDVPIDTVTKPIVTPVRGRTIEVGTGSGELFVDGSTLPLSCNDYIVITKGVYKSITIKNIHSKDGCPIVVTNQGLVEIAGDFSQMNLANLDGVIISGDGDPNIKYGFQFRDNVYRAVTISQPYNNCTIQYASFKNIGDYVITYSSNLVYNGSEESYSRELKFLNLYGENTSSLIQLHGSVENGQIIGLVKNLEIANLDYKNSKNVATMVWAGNVQGYNVHHNRVDNVNSENNRHSGIFHMMGYGEFHDNFISNHQGNAIRAWTYTIGSVPKDVLIYNNIVVNSRKYSAFECQSFANYMSGQVVYANTQVFNNTCGNINLENDWYGSIVDVYNLHGGNCKVFNNIGFNFPSANPANQIINQQGGTNEGFNNLYYNRIEDVGFSDVSKYTLNSNAIAKGAGKIVVNLLKDYYGQNRSLTHPSNGAVE